MRKLALLLLFITMVTTTYAQQSKIATDDLATYNQAVDLYQEDQYLASQRLFEKVLETVDDEVIRGNASYYIANCAVRLNQRNSDQLIEKFVEEYPTSIKKNSAIIDVADYYFDNGNYRKAATWYQRVDKSTLSRKQINRYYFNTGYTLVQAKKFDEAKPFLNRVSDDKEYGSKAKYYLGYIAYENDEVETATELFNQVGESPEDDEKLSYYKADLNYKSGKFDEAIKLAKEQLPKSNRREKSQLNRIIGQSLFNQEKYDEALPYLQEYEGTRGKWNNNDYYQLGYAYYKQGNFEKAIETFNKIIDGANATAQNAYYHLGQSYIKLDRNEDALNAFKKASEMDLDAQISEDASYNYAKLSYENGNPYDSVPAVILAYLEKYPDSDKKSEMNEFLIDSYFSSKNYKEALRLLEDGRIKGNEAVYGKVALYHGLNLFTSGEYQDALENLDKAVKYVVDPELKKKTIFWKAETMYQLNNFTGAYENFKKAKAISTAIEEDDLYNYDMGYAQFKLKKYDEAIKSFTAFTKQSGANNDRVRLNDAYLRIGDANFVTKQYWPGMEAYNKAIELNGFNSDYAAFQKAISYGFVQRNDRKIEDLEAFIQRFKTSKYIDDVIYELGNTYINTNQVSDGIRTYDKLISGYPNSIYTSQAMMRKGLQLYNDGNLDQSLIVFKQVAEKYAGTPQAVQAISSARQVYIDKGNTNDYAVWVRSLDGVEVTDNELDDTAYESAEQPFIKGDMSGTAREMKKYLDQFPNGKHALKAHFYLAQAQFSENKKAESVPHYEYVVSKERSEFTEQALARLSEIHLATKDYDKAIPVLKQLEQLADFPQNVIYAQSNLMKAYYETEKYAEAVKYANKVLADTSIENNVKSDAEIIIARSSWKQGNEAAAKTGYEKVRETATGSLAAEATYYKAYFENKQGDHDAVITTVNGLSKNYGGYKLWSAKGLVVMAKSYYALDQTLNATTILDAVIANFTQYPEVVTNAKNELAKIKTEVAKTNSSVVPANQN
ncbi:tetratricopeptide repeat protein [Nonlabens dokdonensis]|uniref:Tetratricopeptide repeat protein n=1 Tax=Nonlabens dokdonensis TaxID=328515 RepID=A0ABX5PZP5_9FLAO|nr:tetratricopeptide repeat protein [Nonlabens dokdonensis]PZX43264.1 tetratricopeptide repeat protein [Nonlabens dokdonensis]